MGIQPKEFLDKLVVKGIITKQQATQHEVGSLKKEMPIDQYLLQYTNLDREDIIKTKADLLNVAYVNMSTTAVDPQALALLPESVSKRHSIMPYMYDDKNKVLYVATSDPLNVSLQDFIEMKAGVRSVLALADSSDIAQIINLSYSKNISPEVEQAVAQAAPNGPKIKNSEKILDKSLTSAPIA
ncbi:hypothetical protein COY14_01225, partial [Candidatus Roizmanbacteria bacterium CG_4_10_14_0_2_um_filter_36_9]